MEMSLTQIKSWAQLFIISALLMFFAQGCGGGTTGTGDTTNAHIRGYIASSSGQAQYNLEVIHAETGNSTSTDSAGNFDIATTIDSADPSLIVRGPGIDSMVTLNNVPAGTSEIIATLQVDVRGIVSVVEIEIGAPQVAPTPTTTPENTEPGGGSSKPTPTATPNSGVGGEVPNQTSGKWVFDGTIVGSNGAPYSGARVSISPGAASATTGSSGTFSLTVPAQGTTAQLSVTANSLAGQATIRNLPKDGARIRLKMTLSIEPAAIDPTNPNAPTEKLVVRVNSVAIN